MDLDSDSEDEDEKEADGSGPDGSKVLLDTEVLAPDSAALIALLTSPAEGDSRLLLDALMNHSERKFP